MSGLELDFRVARNGFRLGMQLVVPAGRTVALLGPNGAGKSSAVSVIAGLLPIDEGSVVIGGVPVDKPDEGVFVAPEDRRVGVVFQDIVLFPHMTALQNVAFGPTSSGVTKTEALHQAERWIRRVGLAGYEDRRPAELSGGQAQRIALARALALAPDVLVLDEPLASIDVTSRSDLRRLLLDHLEMFPGSRVVITHDPAEAFLLGDDVCVLEDGNVTQFSSPAEMRLRPRTPYIADLGGANLVPGVVSSSTFTTHSGHSLTVLDTGLAGPAHAMIHARAIAVHSLEPSGSPRNVWRTSVQSIEDLGERVRLALADPLRITAEITPESLASLALSVGDPIWVSVKATEISVQAG